MTFKEIQDEVEVIVKDESLFDLIPSVINDIYAEVVNEARPPALKTPMSVATVVGQSWLTLPSGVFGSLLFAGSATGGQLTVVGSLEALMEEEPGLEEEGDLEKVAMEGGVLWYRKRPSVATNFVALMLRAPAKLVLDSSTPDCIPEYLHRRCLIYGAAAALWSILEEGIDGEKVNSMNYSSRYEQGKLMLLTWIGRQRKHIGRSIWSQ
jgi:hypothetical protein